jgi:hypothetical protein
MSDYGKWFKLNVMTKDQEVYSRTTPRLNTDLLKEIAIDYITIEETLHGEVRWHLKAHLVKTRCIMTIFKVEAQVPVEKYQSWCEPEELSQKIPEWYSNITE